MTEVPAPSSLRATLEEGPARLDRSEVAASQRRRLVAAMALAVDAKGFARVTVADVVRIAGVSRATFYEQFENLTDCYLGCYDAGVEIIQGEVGLAVLETDDPRQAVRSWLTHLLGHLSANPEMLRVWYVDIYAVGPEAVRRRVDNLTGFAQQIHAMHGALEAAGDALPGFRLFDAWAIAAGLSSMITNRVALGEAADLIDLVDDLEAFVHRSFGVAPR